MQTFQFPSALGPLRSGVCTCSNRQETPRESLRHGTMAGLEAAVRAGDAAGVKNALEVLGDDPDTLGAKLDADGDLGEGGALHLASFLGSTSVIEVLLGGERGAEGSGGGGALAALERGTVRVEATALMCAAAAGHEAAVVLLLDRGADLAATDFEGSTALMEAAAGGHPATAAVLLDRGADVAATKSTALAMTALLFAAQNGRAGVAALLLDRGADVAATDGNGTTALMLAAQSGSTALAALLLDRGTDVAATDGHGMPALLHAAWKGHAATAALLLDRGADVAATDRDGGTALMIAAQNSHTATAALLLDRGADVAATDGHGMTALMCAVQNGHMATAAVLLDRGADTTDTDIDSMSALMWAAFNGHAATAELLLNHGADLAARGTHGGHTALVFAVIGGGHTQTAALLAFFGAEAPPEDRQQLPVLAVLHTWCRLRIAATFRLHGLLRRALRSGAIGRDPCRAVAAGAAVLAASDGPAPQLPGWAGLPVCTTTARLVRDAASGWSTTRHWLHHGGFRAVVHTLLLVQAHAARPASAPEAGHSLPYLPVELWLLVCRQLRREDFPCGPLPAPDAAMRPRPWVHALD